MIKKKKKHKNERLFEIADRQMGYFTSKQAQDAGFIKNNHGYYVNNGHWKRFEQGIYRLVNYPSNEYEYLFVWYLWSRGKDDNPQGVFSHQTALSIYDLSDNNPSKIHMTAPKNFRKFNGVPEEIVIHRKKLTESDIKSFNGMKITTPLKTIIDIIDEDVLAGEIIRQAVREAYQKGFIMKKDIEKYQKIKGYMTNEAS